MTEYDPQNKDYFKIGEVSRIVGVKEYSIRYWVSELPALKPIMTPTGYRLFKKKDVETIMLLKKLIYGEGLTLSGAKKRLQEQSAAASGEGEEKQLKKVFGMVRQQLLDLRKMLGGA